MTKQNLIILILVFLLPLACKNNAVDSENPPGPPWQSLGLTGKGVQRVVLAEPFLYACLGDDGLWRLDLQLSDTNWVYIGLGDSSLGRQNTGGVQDVVISENNPNWLLAITRPLVELAHGIFRSLDGGKTWLPSDSDLMYTSPSGYSGYFQPNRFLKLENTILAAGQGFNVFRTKNFGSTWEATRGGVGPGLLKIKDFTSTRAFNNVIWLGGETSFFREFLAKSTDAGNTWFAFNPLQNIDRSGANSVVLDPADTSIVYVGLAGQIIKTTDAGITWRVALGQGAVAMLLDPIERTHLWASSHLALWETRDAGVTWTEIEDAIPTPINISDMIWDEKRELIYMSTATGLFRYRP